MFRGFFFLFGAKGLIHSNIQSDHFGHVFVSPLLHMLQSQVLSFLQGKTGRLQKWFLRMELLKMQMFVSRNHESLQHEDHELYQKTISKCYPLIYIRTSYNFSPSRQTLAVTGSIAKAGECGIIIDVESGHILHTIPNVSSLLLPSDESVLYVTSDKLKRPYQIWSNKLGNPASNKLVFNNQCESCHLNMSLSRDSSYVIITSSSRLSSEVYLMPVGITVSPYMVKSAQPGVFYFMEHANGRFYILTNHKNQKQYKVMIADDDNPSIWKDYCTPDYNLFILQDMEVFEDFIVLYGTTPSLTPAVLVKKDVDQRLIIFERYSHIEKLPRKFKSKSFQVTKSSAIATPKKETISYDDDDLSDYAAGFNKKFTMFKTVATADDGTQIPVTLFYNPLKLKMNGRNPLLVKAYGSHGISLYTGYDEALIPLLNRGWVLAFCHIRGGGELGKHWHLQAVKESKTLSFTDLLSCISALHSNGYSSPEYTAAYGISSGALSVSMACNYKPHLMAAVILEMPLVNLSYNFEHTNHYIDLMDAEEFGHSVGSPKEQNHIVKLLCPFYNIKEQNYPSFYITASTVDDMVPYTGVCQFVNKLKNSINNFNQRNTVTIASCNRLPRGTVIFQKEMQLGHWANSNELYYKKQGLNRILFLIQAVNYNFIKEF